MKRKVKKGPGTSRNMPVKDLKHLFTKYKECKYVTAGKLYRIVEGLWASMTYVVGDDGRAITAPIGCTSTHLDSIGRWEHPFK